MNVHEKWKDTARLFLNYLNQNDGTESEGPATTVGRQIRNCTDLLGFALEREEWDKVELYKEKLCQFHKVYTFCVVDLFDRIQFSAPRKYYDLMIELLERMDVTMQASNNVAHDALESVPIFLACVGAEIKLHQSESFDRFIGIGKLS